MRCLEVPCPKPNRPYKRGYEHIELVVGQVGDSCEDVTPVLNFITLYPDLTFDKAALSKSCNQDV